APPMGGSPQRRGQLARLVVERLHLLPERRVRAGAGFLQLLHLPVHLVERLAHRSHQVGDGLLPLLQVAARGRLELLQRQIRQAQELVHVRAQRIDRQRLERLLQPGAHLLGGLRPLLRRPALDLEARASGRLAPQRFLQSGRAPLPTQRGQKPPDAKGEATCCERKTHRCGRHRRTLPKRSPRLPGGPDTPAQAWGTPPESAVPRSRAPPPRPGLPRARTAGRPPRRWRARGGEPGAARTPPKKIYFFSPWAPGQLPPRRPVPAPAPRARLPPAPGAAPAERAARAARRASR